MSTVEEIQAKAARLEVLSNEEVMRLVPLLVDLARPVRSIKMPMWLVAVMGEASGQLVGGVLCPEVYCDLLLALYRAGYARGYTDSEAKTRGAEEG